MGIGCSGTDPEGRNTAQEMGRALVRQLCRTNVDEDTIHDILYSMIEELAQLSSTTDRHYRSSIEYTMRVLCQEFNTYPTRGGDV
jgi:hypothetical protein